jgi:hypothetical protein
VAVAKSNARVNRDHSKVSGVWRIDAGLSDGGTKWLVTVRGRRGPIKLFAGGGDLVSGGFGFAAQGGHGGIVGR